MGYQIEKVLGAGRKSGATAIESSINELLSGRRFSSRSAYLALVGSVVSSARSNSLRKPVNQIYGKEIHSIERGLALTEKTPWGGVSLKSLNVKKDYVRKLLVVRKFGKLGFEYHRLKHERLRVLEGSCLVLYSNHGKPGWRKGKVSYKIAKKGDRFDFHSFDEHGMVALTDCVIEEQSDNHLDDIVFVFNAN